MTEPKNKGGRPLMHGEVQRAAIALRVTPSLNERLRAAAVSNGRSLTQEVCSRLERTFTQDDVVEDLRAVLRDRL